MKHLGWKHVVGRTSKEYQELPGKRISSLQKTGNACFINNEILYQRYLFSMKHTGLYIKRAWNTPMKRIITTHDISVKQQPALNNWHITLFPKKHTGRHIPRTKTTNCIPGNSFGAFL